MKWCVGGTNHPKGSRVVGDSHLQFAAGSQPRCQMQTGSELKEKKESLSLWLHTNSASSAQLTDIRCFWKRKHPSFYDSSVIPTVPHQDSRLPVSFPRRSQHVRCLCHFKPSLIPSFFLGVLPKRPPCFFTLAPLCTDYHSGLQIPKFLSCVLLASPVQSSNYYKC